VYIIGTGFGRSNIWYAESAFGQTVVIPKVLEYITTYTGDFANEVITEDMLQEVICQEPSADDFEDICAEGDEYLEEEEYLVALKYYNTARLIEETPDMLYNIAFCLENLNSFA